MKKQISSNNPCPFLRALEAYGYVKAQSENLFTVAKKISKVGVINQSKSAVPRGAVFFIALMANGFGPLRLWKSLAKGIDIGDLRDGPFDKHGVGSAIINSDGTINQEQLQRLNLFAVDVMDPESQKIERGLKLDQLKNFMDANFERAQNQRRKIDRALMDGEWPVLLKVMGKDQGKNRYLSLEELNSLFLEQRLPDRVLKRLQ